MKLTLREFLETGRLGDIRLGMTRAEAQALLGPPEDISLTKDAVWKYGSLQLYFHENRLWLIALYFPWDELRLPNAFEAVGYLPSRATTLQEFRKFLAESGSETNLDRTVDEAVILQVGPGIEVIFHREPEQILLETMQWSGQPPVRERVKESR